MVRKKRSFRVIGRLGSCLCIAVLVTALTGGSISAASAESSLSSVTEETDVNSEESWESGEPAQPEEPSPGDSSVTEDPEPTTDPVPTDPDESSEQDDPVYEGPDDESSFEHSDSDVTHSDISDTESLEDTSSDSESSDSSVNTTDESKKTTKTEESKKKTDKAETDKKKTKKAETDKKTTKKAETDKKKNKTAEKKTDGTTGTESEADTDKVPTDVSESTPEPSTYDTSYVYTNPIVISNPYSFTVTGFKAIGKKLLVIDNTKSFGIYGSDGEEPYLNVYDDSNAMSEIIGHLKLGAVLYSIADEDKEWRFIEAVDADGRIIRGFCRAEYLKDAPQGVDVTEESAAAIIKTSKVEFTKSFRYSILTTQTELLKQIESADDVVSRSNIVNYATQFLGNPYVWGGESLTSGCDCSGFTMQIYRAFGIELPRYSYEQAEAGTKIPVQDALPGDLVFYSRDGQVYHVMMISGFDEDDHPLVIHASSSTTGIIISRLNLDRACWACRFISDPVFEERGQKTSEDEQKLTGFETDWTQNISIDSRFQTEGLLPEDESGVAEVIE